jgi:hypothetical protein
MGDRHQMANLGGRRPRRRREAIASAVVALLVATGSSVAMGAVGHAPPRAVTTAAGAGGSQVVGFTVRRTMLVVVGSGCRPLELWANFTGQPGAADVRAVAGRWGSVSGSRVNPACARAAFRALHLDRTGWTVPGEVWGG